MPTRSRVLRVAIVATCIKLLLLPTDLYRSTDFEVHRNWLAITHSLPLREWYVEDTSQWTLDYPPLFAWFEWLLSQLAVLCDPRMVEVDALEYASTATVVFQRLSVVLADVLLVGALVSYCRSFARNERRPIRTIVTAALTLCSFGLVVVDHIHFQYNGFLFGLLVASIAAFRHRQYLAGALLFALLLNFKHIFLYVAPAYFIFLLRAYCFHVESATAQGRNALSSFSLSRFLSLAGIVASVFLVTWIPFIYLGQIPQVLSRLFPFKRGLVHSYWAPNFWALYNVADKLLAKAFSVSIGTGVLTGGLVGDVAVSHAVLPTVKPIATFVLSFVTMIVPLIRLWKRPNVAHFERTVVLCAFSAFLFGWHVHEKAVLLMLIPLGLLSTESASMARVFTILSISGSYSLFPLLFRPQETLTKVTLLGMYTLMQWFFLHFLFHDASSSFGIAHQSASLKAKANSPNSAFSASDRDPSSAFSSSSSNVIASTLMYGPPSPLTATSFPRQLGGLPIAHDPLCLSLLERLYLIGFLPLFVSTDLIAPLLLPHLPFLPLMCTSVYCALGVMWSWWCLLVVR